MYWWRLGYFGTRSVAFVSQLTDPSLPSGHICTGRFCRSCKEDLIVAQMSTLTTDAANMITAPPVLHNDLGKRAIATCGYVSGNSASPLTCPNGYNCATAIHTDAVFGCCNNIECLDDWGWCRDFGQGGCQGFDLEEGVCTGIFGPVLQCSAEAPHCFRYARSSARGDSTTYYSRACGTASQEILVLATATNGGNPVPVSPTTAVADDPFTLIPGFTQTLGPTSPTSGPSSSSSSGSSGPKLSTTAIALIAVAGLVVLALTLLFGYCCCWRRRDKRRNIVHSIEPVRPPYVETEPPAQGPGSINDWNLDVPVGASPSVAPSRAGGSEYGGPSRHQMAGPKLFHMHSGGSGQRSY
ncbi:hypothetical protein IAQ61_008820 [Plenodomus lingam]|uniref:uncharacterized protein n=1 Tax=Leptosphaeria maculans TaxID=5022 RepID=UPI00332A72CC|nr:hypothetical protein IAQ61_008820 [Plenodomus lingam]